MAILGTRYNNGMSNVNQNPCNCEPMCTTCGRPWVVCKGECGCKKSCCNNVNFCEYGKKVSGCLRSVEPSCPMQAVIPSVVVEDVTGLKNLADCFVHVTNINTTFYIDDKHRTMITWAGPVEYDNYDLDANTLGLRSQFLIDKTGGYVAYYDKTGTYEKFVSAEGVNEPVVLTMSYSESGSDWTEAEINGAAMSGAYASGIKVSVATFSPTSASSISFTNETTHEQFSISDVYGMLESGTKIIVNNAPIGIVIENGGEVPALTNTADGVELKKQRARVSAEKSVDIYTGTAFLMVDGDGFGGNATMLGMAIGPNSELFVQGIRKNRLD